ncbi:MAG: fluoride efflux transporter CrcB [Pirellulaceae bacterium]|nr:fluoride efflux transporter CrcB [Pirellulaceae bacterium]
MWWKFACLFVAGGLGSLARVGLSTLVQRWNGGDFPLGTLAVNLLGCLLFGLVWSLADQKSLMSAQTSWIILAGFMGAFTTFSAFAFESNLLVRQAQWGQLCVNLLSQNVLGIGAVFVGSAIPRWL